jgi:hypothetical protein
MGKIRTLRNDVLDFRVGKEASRIERDEEGWAPPPGKFTIRGPRKRIVRSTSPISKYKEKLKTDLLDFKQIPGHRAPNLSGDRRLLDYEQSEADPSRSLLGTLPGIVDPDINEYWETLEKVRHAKTAALNDAAALQKHIDAILPGPGYRAHKAEQDALHEDILEFVARCDDTPENHKMLPNIKRLRWLATQLLNLRQGMGSLRKKPKKTQTKKKPKKKQTKKKPKKKHTKKKPKKK